MSMDEKKTSHKLKNAYWTTKQAMMHKLGRQEDVHIVHNDAELDSKLDLLKCVQSSCAELLRVIKLYEEKLCALSKAEHDMAQFLKKKLLYDKTKASTMMSVVGKSLDLASHQRLTLCHPLSRLHQEMETFQCRAITDTLATVQRMESARTDYRGSLLWLKDQSVMLDPDEFKRLEKFRKVQDQVRKSKDKFDQLKLDSLQKIDLLVASRCNLYSHVLAPYQTVLTQFCEKIARIMNAIAECFDGSLFYEFNVLKSLTDECRKCDTTGRNSAVETTFEESLRQLDAIFLQEFEDLPEELNDTLDVQAPPCRVKNRRVEKNIQGDDAEMEQLLKNVDNDSVVEISSPPSVSSTVASSENESIGLLDQIFSLEVAQGYQQTLGEQWAFDFGSNVSANVAEQSQYLPSSLLDQSLSSQRRTAEPCKKWLDLFADLDPLSNPDILCKKECQIIDT